MLDLLNLNELSDWVVRFADSDWSVLVLAINAFTESIFFPVPPDALLIGISIVQPERALWLAALVTASSVGGAVVGHWLGRRLGRPIVHRLASESKVAEVERAFGKYGAWAVLLAAFTPIPYKVFAILAGALNLNLRSFAIASLIGRGARFFILGGLLFVYGDSVEEFLHESFGIVTIAAGVGLLAALGVVGLLARRRRAKRPAG